MTSATNTGKLLSHTLAWCAACRKKIQARLVDRAGKIYLQKACPKHGISEVLASGDSAWYLSSRAYIKPSQEPLGHKTSYKGCPESCGFCPEHQQHTCLPVIEILDRCDMNCPVCLKDFNRPFEFSLKDFKRALGGVLKTEGGCPVINLSGGEPTLHPLFRDFITHSYSQGVLQVTVSTTGLRLLADKELRAFFKDTGTIAALQFDGFSPDSWRFMRGDPALGQKKLRLMELLEKEGVKYSLVATVAKGVNDTEIGKITDFFFRSKALSLMFQPLCFTGRASGLETEKYRLTIPDIVKAAQKSRFIGKDDFNPLPCSHYSCFALAYYLASGKGSFISLKDFLGREFYLDAIANKTLPGLDKSAYGQLKEKIYALWSAADSSSEDQAVLDRIRGLIRGMERDGFSPKTALTAGMDSMKAVFIHCFMDAHNMDFGRLVKCCNPYAGADGRLVPMCSQNTFFQG
jgi:uncharacterized radical SAM superfamily Fe-S cluster-containing enzyme